MSTKDKGHLQEWPHKKHTKHPWLLQDVKHYLCLLKLVMAEAQLKSACASFSFFYQCRGGGCDGVEEGWERRAFQLRNSVLFCTGLGYTQKYKSLMWRNMTL